MNGIKIILVTAFAAAILVWAFRNRHHVGLRAGGRVAFAASAAALAVVSARCSRSGRCGWRIGSASPAAPTWCCTRSSSSWW